jgi:hypothetical protein
MTGRTPSHLSGPGAPVRRTVTRLILASIPSNDLGAVAILFCFVFLYPLRRAGRLERGGRATGSVRHQRLTSA